MAPIGDKCLDLIRGIDRSLEVVDVSKLVTQPAYQPTTEEKPAETSLDGLMADAEILFGLRHVPDLLKKAPKLKWIQAMSAGVENILTQEIVRSEIRVTNVSGMHTVPINELVFGMMLSYAKGLPRCWQNKAGKKWERYSPELLYGKTLGVIGLGKIGMGIVRTGKFFGMRTTGVCRRGRQQARTRWLDAVYSVRDLHVALPECDYIVLALPYTQSTDKLIGEKELNCMKPGVFLVNIGRGKTVDESALIAALKEGRIGGAGLDTFEIEPLPNGSPLWDMDNVIITPHIAGAGGDYSLKATEIFCENLKRYLAGKRLINLVDKKQGY